MNYVRHIQKILDTIKDVESEFGISILNIDMKNGSITFIGDESMKPKKPYINKTYMVQLFGKEYPAHILNENEDGSLLATIDTPTLDGALVTIHDTDVLLYEIVSPGLKKKSR